MYRKAWGKAEWLGNDVGSATLKTLFHGIHTKKGHEVGSFMQFYMSCFYRHFIGIRS
jgi:hypothetical protein